MGEQSMRRRSFLQLIGLAALAQAVLPQTLPEFTRTPITLDKVPSGPQVTSKRIYVAGPTGKYHLIGEVAPGITTFTWNGLDITGIPVYGAVS